MARAALIAALTAAVALWQAQPAAAATTARAVAQATIVEAVGVRMNWSMAMPSVQGGISGASFMGNMPSMGMVMMMMPSTTGFSVRREDSSGAPVTAPASFAVLKPQGEEALIVKTGANSELRVAANGSTIVGGAIVGGAAASIAVNRNVGSQLATPSPGALVVVVQYN